MRADRIFATSLCGDESLALLRGLHSGINGINANSAAHALEKLETQLLMADARLTLVNARRLIKTTLQLVVHMDIMPDGTRRVTEILEIIGMGGMHGDELELNPLFKINCEERDEKGFLVCNYTTSRRKPKFVEQFKRELVHFDPSWLK